MSTAPRVPASDDVPKARMSKQRIATNLLVMGTGQVATSIISALYLVVISRYFGPIRLGELLLATAIGAVVSTFIGLGMEPLITRTVARDAQRAGALSGAAVVVRLALGIPAFGTVFLFVHLAHFNGETRLVSYLYVIGVVLSSCGRVLYATFQAHERMSLPTASKVAGNMLGLEIAGIVMWRRGGVVLFATLDVLGDLILLGLNLRWMRQFARIIWRVSLHDIREVTVGSLAFWSTGILLSFYTYVDTVILGTLAGSAAVGQYGPATRLFGVALVLPGIIGAVTAPLLSRLGVEAGADFTRVGRKTLVLLVTAAVPLTIGLASFAHPLITTIYGASYRAAVPVLVVLSLSILPMFLNVQFSQVLTARDQQWRWTIAMGLGCVVNPILNLLLIPWTLHSLHNGAIGAAWALLGTELLQMVFGAVCLRAMLRDRALLQGAVCALAAGVAQVATLRLTSNLWSPLSEVLALIVYALAAIVLGALPREDIAAMWNAAVHPGWTSTAVVSPPANSRE